MRKYVCENCGYKSGDFFEFVLVEDEIFSEGTFFVCGKCHSEMKTCSQCGSICENNEATLCSKCAIEKDRKFVLS